MTLEVFNQGEGIEDPSGVWPLAQPERRDWEIAGMAAGGANGVSSGCVVTAQGSPNMTVAVTSGTVVVNNVEAAVSSGNVTITAAHATLRRRDFIVVNNSGVKSAVAGTPASVPAAPAIPASSVVIALVYVPAADTAINSNQIARKDIPVPTPSGFSGWSTIDKAAGTPRSSTTTLAVDPDLQFTMAAGGKYRLRGRLFITTPDAADFKWRHVGPASPNRVFISRRYRNSATGAETDNALDNAFSTADIFAGVGAELTTVVEFEGVVHNATAGDFEIWWAQNASNAGNTEVLAASYIEYSRAD